MNYALTEDAIKFLCSNGGKIDYEDVVDGDETPSFIQDMTSEELDEICDFDEGMNEENIIPKATKSLLGCVVVGDGLDVDANGVLSNGFVMEKVWENASPTSSFAVQTISMDLSEYDFVIVEAQFASSANIRTQVSARTPKTSGSNTVNRIGIGTGGTAAPFMYYVYRNFTVNSTGVYFGEGYRSKSSMAEEMNNGYCVPLAIYRIKGVS